MASFLKIYASERMGIWKRNNTLTHAHLQIHNAYGMILFANALNKINHFAGLHGLHLSFCSLTPSSWPSFAFRQHHSISSAALSHPLGVSMKAYISRKTMCQLKRSEKWCCCDPYLRFRSKMTVLCWWWPQVSMILNEVVRCGLKPFFFGKEKEEAGMTLWIPL